MEEKDQHTCANLRLLGIVGKNQYIRTNRNLNITDVVDVSAYNNIMATCCYDTWDNRTKKGLRKLFTIDVPTLNLKLINTTKFDELLHLRVLLYKSKEGLHNLKYYYLSDKLAIATIDSICEEYIDIQVNKMERCLDENGEPYETIRLNDKPNIFKI